MFSEDTPLIRVFTKKPLLMPSKEAKLMPNKKTKLMPIKDTIESDDGRNNDNILTMSGR